MNVLTDSSFGLTIAYLLPGFTSLWGLAVLSPTIRSWLGTPSSDAPSLGGFLYVTVASLTAGLILSTLRWLILDWLHTSTGLKPPRRDFSRLQEQGAAFSILVADLYRYYQFYGNMMFAVAFTYGFGVCRANRLTARSGAIRSSYCLNFCCWPARAIRSASITNGHARCSRRNVTNRSGGLTQSHRFQSRSLRGFVLGRGFGAFCTVLFGFFSVL